MFATQIFFKLVWLNPIPSTANSFKLVVSDCCFGKECILIFLDLQVQNNTGSMVAQMAEWATVEGRMAE